MKPNGNAIELKQVVSPRPKSEDAGSIAERLVALDGLFTDLLYEKFTAGRIGEDEYFRMNEKMRLWSRLGRELYGVLL